MDAIKSCLCLLLRSEGMIAEQRLQNKVNNVFAGITPVCVGGFGVGCGGGGGGSD